MGNYPEKWKGYYLTAYGIAVKHGFQGSEEDWLQHLKAGEMELRYEDGLLQWKTSKEAGWHTLEEFSLLQEQLEESAQKASTAAGAAVLAGQEAQAAGQEAQTAAASATRAAGQALEAKAAAEQAAEAAENTAEAAAESALNTANTAAQTAVDTANAAAQSALDTANSAAQTALAQGEYAKAQGDRAAQLVDEIEETDVGGMAADILELQNGKADLVEGKVPVGQIPALGYDPAGSAASVQAGLSAHLNDTDNPHGVTAAQVGVTAKRTCRFVVGTSTNGWTEDDCDYLCDGVDDQVEIQAAIDALPSSGGEIVILRGDYHMTDNLILKDNVAIRGELNYWPDSNINYASRVTLQKQGSARRIIKGADKVVLENIFTIMYEVNFANSCQAIIRNCNIWITGKLTNTLIENSSGNLTFENLTYSSIINHNGPIFISSGDYVNINGGQNILGSSGSITISGLSNSIVSNIVYGNTSDNGPIITIAGGSYNNIIMGNIINKNYEDAMWNQFGAIYLYGNAYNNLIYGNKLKVGEVANAHSIFFASNTHDNIVMGNSFIKYNYSNAGTNNQFINNFVYEGGD